LQAKTQLAANIPVAGLSHRHAVMMFADIVVYTSLMGAGED
jgi:class 3 adenylate cyclase